MAAGRAARRLAELGTPAWTGDNSFVSDQRRAGETRRGRALWRSLLVLWSAGTIATAACTLTTDLDGLSGEAALSDGAVDALAGDGASDGGGDAIPTDGGADASDPACADPDLVAFFRFDEADGGAVTDCSRYRHVGLVGGAAAWTAGKRGGALDFDGGYVSLGNAAEYQITGALTIAAWINLRQPPLEGGPGYILGKTADPSKSGWRVGVAGDQKVGFSVNGGSLDQIEAPPISANVWTHIAAIYEPGARLEVYVDGKRTAGRNASQAAITNSASEARVALRADGMTSTAFLGALDDVRLYRRALSAAEIAAIASE